MKETLTISDDARGCPAVVVDFDSTLWDLMRAVADHVADDCGLTPDGAYQRLLGEWDGCDRLVGRERTRAAFREVFHSAHMEPYGLFPGAAEGLATLSGEGYRIVVMTHRPGVNITHVARHLDAHGARVHEIQCGPAFDKIAASFAAGAHILVDDKPSTLMAAHEAGLPVTTLRWPYNSQVLDERGIPHAGGWDTDLLDVIRSTAASTPLTRAA